MLFQHFKIASYMEEEEMLIIQPLFCPLRSPKSIGRWETCPELTVHNVPAHFTGHVAVPTVSQSHICSWRDENLVTDCWGQDRPPQRLCSHQQVSKTSESRSVKQLVLRILHPCSTHFMMFSFSQVEVGPMSCTPTGTWTAPSSLVSCKRNQIHVLRDSSINVNQSMIIKEDWEMHSGDALLIQTHITR